MNSYTVTALISYKQLYRHEGDRSVGQGSMRQAGQGGEGQGGEGQGSNGQGRASTHLGAIQTLASGNALAKGPRKILCS